MQRYSVLMSVYHKEKQEYLRQAMESVYRQTVPTDNFVLVCDGPIGSELESVIASMQEKFQEILTVVRLQKNVGLGNALNEGLKYCKNDLIARMDTDDIAREDRCEKQIEVFTSNPEIGIVSGIVEEFLESTDIVTAQRKPPEKHDQILKFAKKRSPFNHPCVMYRKSAVEAVGGYREIFLLEDYYLWVRMLTNGTVGYNIQEPLLWMRAGSNMYKRRGGMRYIKAQLFLFSYMKQAGFISTIEYVESVTIRALSGLAPAWLREFMFEKILRSRQSGNR